MKRCRVRWRPALAVLVISAAAATACQARPESTRFRFSDWWPQEVDLSQALQLTDVTTGWFDAGIVDGKNKLVPTITFRLKNVGSAPTIRSVQINAVVRRQGEAEEWGSAFVQAIDQKGLAPGEATPLLVLRSPRGYTGTQPRGEMLQNREFVDVAVQVFAKHGSAQWVKLAERKIERQLLTR